MDQKTTVSQIATKFYGHLDDKRFHARKEAEIQDWLDEGEPEGLTLQQLCNEWAEYDAEEIARLA